MHSNNTYTPLYVIVSSFSQESQFLNIIIGLLVDGQNAGMFLQLQVLSLSIFKEFFHRTTGL